MRLMKSILRASAVLSSLGLLIGCVWFTHKQANPVIMPGSKSGTIVMPGSKSYTGATTISAGALQQAGKQQSLPTKP